MTVLLVVAKAPVAGQVKTRLSPPAGPRRAAAVAAAALLDTLDTVRAVPDVVPVLALAGDLAAAERGDEISRALAGWRLVRQRGDGLAERLVAAHADTAAIHPGRPVLQIGMDTPQVTPDLLVRAVEALTVGPAALGRATDGGWWALGLRDPRHAGALRKVPMSSPDTGRRTVEALAARGLRVAELPVLSDVDTWPDAVEVAGLIGAAGARTGGRFAAAVAELAGDLAAGVPR